MNFKTYLLAAGFTASMLGAVTVPNASFEESSQGKVPGWRLTNSRELIELANHPDGSTAAKYRTNPDFGGTVDQAPHGSKALFIKGNGKGGAYWLSDHIDFKNGEIYQLSYDYRKGDSASGSITSGPVFLNIGYSGTSTEWVNRQDVFMVPECTYGAKKLRFGHWMGNGTFFFDNVTITPVQPVYLSQAGFTLGRGETLQHGTYSFVPQFGNSGRNHSRPLHYTNAHFNTNRWLFAPDTVVIYRHNVGDRPQTRATVNANVGYHASGKLLVSVSTDQKTWHQVGEVAQSGQVNAPVPEALLPAKTIYVKLESKGAGTTGTKESNPGSFQVNRYGYEATLADVDPQLSLQGITTYVKLQNSNRELDVNLLHATPCSPRKPCLITAQLTNKGSRDLTIKPHSKAIPQKKSGNNAVADMDGTSVTLKPNQTQTIQIPFVISGCGGWDITTVLAPQVTMTYHVDAPVFYDDSYGELIRQHQQADIWTASSGWKINLYRALPTATAATVKLAMAANETEATQLVVTPRQALRNLTLTASALTSDKGATIPASQVELLDVYYHNVTTCSDAQGVTGMWPDALPPIAQPLALPARIHHPFWLRVHAPKGTPAGLYKGNVTLKADQGFTATVPLEIRVFGFTLPDEMTCETAFGFSPQTAYFYHKITDPKQKRELVDKYHRNLAKHHISPYDPAPFDRFTFKVLKNGKPILVWSKYNVRDDKEFANGTQSLKVTDTSTEQTQVAHCTTMPPISGGPIRVKLNYKSPKGQVARITFMYQDSKGDFIRKANLCMPLRGTGAWKSFEKTVEPPQGATRLRVSLSPTLWTRKGEKTGTAWFDDIHITDVNTKKVLLEDDFEPVSVQNCTLEFDWTQWDAAMQKAMDTYHFNTFRFPIKGLGSGTFYRRTQPAIAGFPEGTPEYTHILKLYLKEVQDHLVQKGWIDKAFIYWFDEPSPQDYDFVMNGFRKLKEGAPRLRRMLTEQVETELIGGPNLWCPINSSFVPESMPERVKAGDTFWWYTCMGDKTPFNTLYIDHPGTEMRVWLWQSWHYGIKGVLVWNTNYWWSTAAYPDRKNPQNPYLDPMGWGAASSGNAIGSKNVAGNGEGKFLYPPLAAADGKSTKPIMDDPVDCYRAEMLRDGIEDYEYFVILQKLIEENPRKLSQDDLRPLRELLKVPRNISVSTTDFTSNPQTMEIHRLKLAEAIEKLTR